MQIAIKLKYNEIEKWYNECLCKDFLENEIKPLDNIIDLCRNERYDIYVYKEDDAVIGYATIWKRKGFKTYLLDYLGVPESLRNKGIGRIILNDIRERLCQEEQKDDICMILESETPEENDDSDENILRKRRIGFYKRNHFIEIYEMGTCGVRFTAFSYKILPENIDCTMREHRMIYGEERQDIVIPLPKGVKPPMPFWIEDERK